MNSQIFQKLQNLKILVKKQKKIVEDGLKQEQEIQQYFKQRIRETKHERNQSLQSSKVNYFASVEDLKQVIIKKKQTELVEDLNKQNDYQQKKRKLKNIKKKRQLEKLKEKKKKQKNEQKQSLKKEQKHLHKDSNKIKNETQKQNVILQKVEQRKTKKLSEYATVKRNSDMQKNRKNLLKMFVNQTKTQEGQYPLPKNTNKKGSSQNLKSRRRFNSFLHD